MVLVMYWATQARVSRESCMGHSDKGKWWVLPSPSSRPSKRACPLPATLSLSLSPPPCLSLAVLSLLLGRPLGVDVGTLQECLEQSE